MMTLHYKYILAMLVACFSSLIAMAQEEETRNFKIDMILTGTDKGEVLVDMKTKCSALYWDIYKRKMANNPSILKSSLVRSFCKYSLTNFNVTNYDMERTYQATFTILGMLQLEEGGKWIARLETKDPDITKISEKEYVMVDEDYAKSFKVILPSTTTKSKIEKDAFGNALLTYYAPVKSGGDKFLIYTGYLLAALGVLLFIKNRFLHKKVTT